MLELHAAALAAVSPPDIATTDWNRRVERFLRGQVAMTYCWTMRRCGFLVWTADPKVKRLVHDLAPPSLRGRPLTAPVGGFLWIVPGAVPAARRKTLVDAIAGRIALPELMKAHVRKRFPVGAPFLGQRRSGGDGVLTDCWLR